MGPLSYGTPRVAGMGFMVVLLIGNWTVSNLDSTVGGSKVLVSASSRVSPFSKANTHVD